MDRATFWATKNPGPEYWALVFDHPNFTAPIRLVADVFATVTLGGHVHEPAPVTIKPPDQSGDGTAKLQAAFPRAHVGRRFKRALALVTGSREPVTVEFQCYLDDLTTPAVAWHLFLSDPGGVTFTPEAVQITATLDNPMRRNVSTIYDPAVFTGLELIG